MRFPDKRDLYFYFEKLSLGQGERKFIYVLFGCILLIQVLIFSKPFFVSEEKMDYSALNKLISERTMNMQQKYDSVLSSQYFPTEKEVSSEMESKFEAKEKAPKVTKTPILINLNSATLSEWINVPGIGEKTAQLILDYRLKNGNFKSVEDLKKIKSIGPKKFEKIREFIKVD